MAKNIKVFDGGRIQVPVTALMKRNLLMVMQEHPQFYITDAARYLMEEGLKKIAAEKERRVEDVRIDPDTNNTERPAFFAS